jgi:hypothetical protein
MDMKIRPWTALAHLAIGLAVTAMAALGPAPAAAQTPLLDLDSGAPADVLDANDDGGFVARGEFGTGVIPATGQGTRMLWHPSKAAFRAGRIDGQGPTLWDDAQVGPYSAAFGIVPLASGVYAFGAGYLVEATNDGAVALGFSTLASGFTSFAAGYQGEATGHSAVALGRQTVASGNYSFAAGALSQATTAYSIAMGYQGQATGAYAVALGANANASGPYSFAAGNGTQATNQFAVAIGDQNQASGLASVALGRQTVASGLGSFTTGYLAQATGARSVALGGGTASGSSAVSLGNGTAAGQSALAMGPYIDVQGAFSTGIGSHVTVPAAHYGSHAFGDRNWGASLTLTTAPHQFAARASGGVRFFTSSDLTTGVTLGSGGSAWASLSDVNAKENFVDLDADYVLDALDGMSIQEWNYRENDDDVRHIGPTAQEFHAAFGLGTDPLRIETIDADGVALAAIQALIRENRELAARVVELETDADRRGDRIAELEARLDALATLMKRLQDSAEGSDAR